MVTHDIPPTPRCNQVQFILGMVIPLSALSGVIMPGQSKTVRWLGRNELVNGLKGLRGKGFSAMGHAMPNITLP